MANSYSKVFNSWSLSTLYSFLLKGKSLSLFINDKEGGKFFNDFLLFEFDKIEALLFLNFEIFFFWTITLFKGLNILDFLLFCFWFITCTFNKILLLICFFDSFLEVELLITEWDLNFFLFGGTFFILFDFWLLISLFVFSFSFFLNRFTLLNRPIYTFNV